MIDASNISLDNVKSVHVIGIGGAGMSAIAELLLQRGFIVSGSDMKNSETTARLETLGARVTIGHDKANLDQNAGVVTHSTAVPDSNPEMIAAREFEIPVLKRKEILTAITRLYKTVAVAGTHGKTTTSAMLTAALTHAGLSPAFIVGGKIKGLSEPNSKQIQDGASTIRAHDDTSGEQQILVVEADESDGTFVDLAAHSVIVTNVEPDHLEYYGSFEKLQEYFVRFVDQAQGPKLLCADDFGAKELAAKVVDEATTYGTTNDCDWSVSIETPQDAIATDGRVVVSLKVTTNRVDSEIIHTLNMPGKYNALNSLAALAMAVELGADADKAAEGLAKFEGVGRRFERRGQIDGITLIDDYAHLPTEVDSAIGAASSLDPKRLVAVFQPHRYSRTEALWDKFDDSFGGADVLYVTGIYSSGEEPREGVTGARVADSIQKANPQHDIRFIESLEDLVDELCNELRDGDLLLTLGAGDLTDIPTELLERLAVRGK